MVVCKFFLQGTCKFGNSCRFEHQLENSPGNSILKQSNQNAPRSTNMDPNTLMQSVINDMMAVEQGKQWVFSSYSPFKDKPTFPGFEDRSFEEIRLGFYEANKTGSVENYKQTIQMWYQEAIGRIRTLQNPNQEIVKLLTQIYNSNQLSGNQQTPFQNNQGNNNNSGFITNTIPQTSIFARNNIPNNSVFGQNTIFNSTNPSPFTTNQSPFGNNTNINPTNNIFNQNNLNQNNLTQNNLTQKPIFGNNSIFNNNQPQQIQQSPFNPQNNTQPPLNNPFGTSNINNNNSNNQSPFGPSKIQQNAQSPFINSNPNQNQAIFNNLTNAVQNQTSIFQSNIQNQPQNNAIFPNANPTSNYYQNPVRINQQPNAMQNVFNNQNPIFGNSILNQNLNSPGIGIKPNVIDNNSYSKIEELTEEEIKWFQSDEFEFGKIPERPPTLEMCF